MFEWVIGLLAVFVGLPVALFLFYVAHGEIILREERRRLKWQRECAG